MGSYRLGVVLGWQDRSRKRCAGCAHEGQGYKKTPTGAKCAKASKGSRNTRHGQVRRCRFVPADVPSQEVTRVDEITHGSCFFTVTLALIIA
jgi:hypothetical protein